MGAGQSTRKMTLVNDDKAGVIKLSESLAYRLRGQLEASKESLSSTVQPAADVSVTPHMLAETPDTYAVPNKFDAGITTHSVEDPVTTNSIAQSQPILLDELTIQDPSKSENVLSARNSSWSTYAEEAHLMAMRLREEKELELKNIANEWRTKMENREKQFTDMAKLTQEQFAIALKEVEILFVKASCSPVCQDQKETVMNCYQDHPGQSLRCSREVEHFAQCVDISRLESVMRQKS